MERQGIRMSRLGLMVWLITPVVIIGALYVLAVDRSKGTPDSRLHAIAAARLPGQEPTNSRFTEDVEREAAATAARAKEAPVVAPAKAQEPAKAPSAATPEPAPTDDPNFVEPESLEGGFIIVVNDKTKTATTSSPIYMPSSHNGWNPTDKGMLLSARSDQRWQIIWEKPKLDSRIAFKFARGSWENVEIGADSKDVDNRLLPKIDKRTIKPGEKPIIELVIEGWKDLIAGQPAAGAAGRYRAMSVSAGTLRRLEVVGGATPAMRDVLVWLPPGYDAPENKARAYPVLYMQDGQNLFEKLPGLPGEWGADETSAKLIGEGKIEPLIIVGIPSIGSTRMSEYSPMAIGEKQVPMAEAYVRFVMGEVMPRVERAFRVKTGPANTAIGGASLGGLVALVAGTSHPEVFGSVLAESTPLVRLGEKPRGGFEYFARARAFPKRVYFGMGGKELGSDPKNTGANTDYAASANAFGELARGKGVPADGIKIVVDPEGEHNEVAWAKRFGPALEFLFPPAK